MRRRSSPPASPKSEHPPVCSHPTTMKPSMKAPNRRPKLPSHGLGSWLRVLCSRTRRPQLRPGVATAGPRHDADPRRRRNRSRRRHRHRRRLQRRRHRRSGSHRLTTTRWAATSLAPIRAVREVRPLACGHRSGVAPGPIHVRITELFGAKGTVGTWSQSRRSKPHRDLVR